MPMGVFFALAHVLHVPVWVAERIWLASLLTVACWGVVRLAEALGIGNRWSRVAAGVAYAVSPIVVTWATTSGVMLAVVMLPWVLTPLVIGSREGSTRRAAARSGIAVALMGGSNAAVVFAVLPLAVIWLFTRLPGPRRRSLIRWWLLAVGMACFWWLVPLVFVAHYGYNYLPYTETSTLTTSSASAFEAIRGASFWINYFNIGQPLLQGPWIIVSESAVIFGTAVVGAFGLAGLCRRIPERLFLVTSLTFGVVVIAAGFAGPTGGLFSPSLQHLLQGPLAAFRNVSKFSADATLPVVLGLASMLSASMEPVRKGLARFAPTASRLRVGLTVLVVAAIFVAAAPFWRGAVYRAGGFAAIPSYWYKTGAFLNQHQGHENALLVPGSSFGYYTWGNPVDEPLQVVAATSLEWRNIIPVGSNGYVQMLDAVEQALDKGVSSPGLAAGISLSRASITSSNATT